MPEQHSYPDLTAPADPVSLVKELRKRRKSISEADLDALERLIGSGASTPVSAADAAIATAAFRERYLAAAKTVPVTADLFTDAGQGQASMQQRIVEALGKL